MKGQKLCVVALGSNTDSEKNIAEAQRLLLTAFGEVTFSKAVYTKPIGMRNSTLFLNQVAKFFVTNSSINQVIFKLKRIEDKLARDRGQSEFITIDIDLLIFKDQLLKREDLERLYIQEGIKELNIRLK